MFGYVIHIFCAFYLVVNSLHDRLYKIHNGWRAGTRVRPLHSCPTTQEQDSKGGTVTSTITRFTDEVPGFTTTINSNPDATFSNTYKPDSDLQNFFARPINIQNYTWNVGSSLSAVISPWERYFSNARVQNRMANFNLVRCKMHVKFMINGNSFYYGRVMCSLYSMFSDEYQPRVSDPQSAWLFDSHRPHVFLDPCTSQGGTLECPMIWQYDALQLPTQNGSQLGFITLLAKDALKHANGATDDLTISIYAWCTDVELSVPTSYTRALVAQAGSDEYGDCPISKPAATVAAAAGKLTGHPLLGPYARATSVAAGAVGSVAKLFGYSAPTNIANRETFRPTPVTTFATTDNADGCAKLTYDSKQEVTIDPRVVGLAGEDEMTLSTLTQREGFWFSIPWNESDIVNQTLVDFRVGPCALRDTNTPVPSKALTSLAYAALPFQYWRGTIKYRFQVVASAYHRGRICVAWDPTYFANTDTNVNYREIIDISQTRDFTMEVGWGQQRSYCKTREPVGEGYSFTPITNQNPEFYNGTIRVSVVTELAVASTAGVDNSIVVHVYTCAGDDFELVSPTDNNIRFLSPFVGNQTLSAAAVEEKEESVRPQTLEAQSGEMEDTPPTTNPDESVAAITRPSEMNSIYFGDPVTSLRGILKRYSLHEGMALPISGVTPPSTWNIVRTLYPMVRGFDPNGIDVSFALGRYNYVNMTPLNYFSLGYLCRRGGVRYKTTIHGNGALGGVGMARSSLYVTRTAGTAISPGTAAADLPEEGDGKAKISNLIVQALPMMSDGGNFTSTDVNPVLEYEIPYHSFARFDKCRKYYENSSTQGPETSPFRITYVTSGHSGSTTSTCIPFLTQHVAAAEDFSLSYYVGPPPLYWYENPNPGN